MPQDPVLPTFRSRSPVLLVNACAVVLILFLLAACAMVLLRLREDTLADTDEHLSMIALTLAEQADRAVQGMDLVLDGVANLAISLGVANGESFDRLLSNSDIHVTLRERMIGLPQLNALILFGMDGHIVNSTRSWPPPSFNIRDNVYFRTLVGDPKASMIITEPYQYRTDGTWTVFLIRKLFGPNGKAAGLLVAAIELRYFEDFYRSVSMGGDNAISLLRADGVQLALYPRATTTGQNFMTGARVPRQSSTETMRDIGPTNGAMRVKALRRLTSYPLIVLVSISEADALGEWWNMVWVLGLATTGCCCAIGVAAVAIGRRWQQREAMSQERENRAMAEAALMRERERNAEEESRAKSGFRAMMSHEIRTPMNGVLGLAGALLDTSLAPDQRTTIEAIRDSGDSLLRILNDILDFSKLESGRMEMEETAFSPATLTLNPVSLLGPRARAKGLELVAICEDGLPEALLGDSGRIRQVLINLVSNAVKFTERGTITIQAGCPARDDKSATMIWRVADTGIGIPPERIGRLFGEFSQADASITRRFGGSGLGLAISKRLIEQMGGTITIESQSGRGSTFTVTLILPVTRPVPAVVAPPADIIGAFRTRLQQLGRPLRILFAEDNPTNQFVAQQLLRGLDVQLDIVGDGLAAVHGAASFLYDVICMDIRMPEMDGLEATRAIRDLGGRMTAIPIIALTANAFPEDVAACYAAGMTNFVAKPVRKETLLAAILAALGTPDPDRAVAPTAAAAVLDDAGPMLDETAFRRLTDEIGADGVIELIAMFTRETRDRLRAIADGGMDRERLIREVHSLKGAAASACAVALAHRAAAAELSLRDDDTLDTIDVAPLTSAFETWCAAVDATEVSLAIPRAA